jgi:diguanylate cyclase (GGDEF)-like protein
VVLLDLTFTEGEDGGLRFLRDLTHRAPPIPVLVFTGRDSFLDRVAVAEAGGRGFLPKSLPASEVVDAVLRVVEERAGARVLAVDDDPQILGVLRALLEAEGMRLTTLADPLGFWDALESTAPDLLVLDVDMPHLTGLDLCKVVRNEARWRTLPILFLTGHIDAQTVQAIFAAGADDYVAKPIVGPELLTRIRNRLERTQLLRRVAEVDPLTGAANRSKAERELDHYLRLARRQGQPVSIAVLDIDHLSEVNARHGNATGDAVLRRTSELLHGLFRSEDIVARWGEDEFLVGMYGMKRSDAVQRAAEIVELLRAEAFGEASREGGQVTLTGGVAQFPADGADLRVLYCRAEDVMSRAKAAGCDRVVPVGWEPSGGAWAGKERVDVVLVDDDETLGALLLHALDTRGYTAAWLQDGEMAVRRLSGPDSDLAGRVVLLDVDLPGRNGLTVLRCLAADGIVRESRVLMLTARSVEDEVVEALQLGAFDHVTKPFSLPILMQRIRRALEA